MSEMTEQARLATVAGWESLLLDGAVQSVAPGGEAEGYWPLLLPRLRPTNALLLGLGGGTVARLLLDRFGPLPLVGVDNDAALLGLARCRGWLDLPGLSVVLADARTFAGGCAARGARFAFVCVDLFSAGGVPEWVCSRRFLALLHSVLTADGVLAFNLSRGTGHQQRLRAIQQQFTVESVAALGMNLVVQARPLPPRRYRRVT